MQMFALTDWVTAAYGRLIQHALLNGLVDLIAGIALVNLAIGIAIISIYRAAIFKPSVYFLILVNILVYLYTPAFFG
jgi:hypothetical protein